MNKEKQIIREYAGESQPLSYPLKQLERQSGGPTQVYDIPERDKPSVLERLYFLEPVPKPGDVLIDLHEEKEFVFKDALVVREDGMNFIVSPYYLKSGGTLLDFAESDDVIDQTHVMSLKKVKGANDAVLTDNLTSKEVEHSNLPCRD